MVMSPSPGILPERGDLLLGAEIDGQEYVLVAGNASGCMYAIEFDFGFDEGASIIGGRFGGLGQSPVGFRLTKVADFHANVPPDYRSRWYDYRFVVCVNEDGDAIDGQLFS